MPPILGRNGSRGEEHGASFRKDGELARNGAKVAITDLNEEVGTTTVREIAGEGGEAVFLRHDVTSDPERTAVVNRTVERWGAPSVVVNNAGIALKGNAENTSLEDWRRLMSVNLDGVFLGTKHGIRAMKEKGGGSIINLSSIEGLVGDPELAAYNASKGGVRLSTKSAALYCAKAKYGIRVNSVHPGYIWTPMVRKHVESMGGEEAAGRRELEKLTRSVAWANPRTSPMAYSISPRTRRSSSPGASS